MASTIFPTWKQGYKGRLAASRQRITISLIAIAMLATTVAPVSAITSNAIAMEALSAHAQPQNDGTTYVSTGDIPAEWLRDASAVAHPYITRARDDEEIARELRGVIRREAKYVLIDAYANAFSPNYGVFERKFELDSLLYPIWFAYDYWAATGDAKIFTPAEADAFDRILTVLHTEQRHNTRSRYRHPALTDGGRGSKVAYTGMVWTGFRPSDDSARYQYNIPDNMLAVVVLRDLARIEREAYADETRAQDAEQLAREIQCGIEQYGRTFVDGIGVMYAYEVDGLGHRSLMDDANIPSLLSIPYIGYLSVTDPIYQNTRRFILSDRNPYYFSGTYASGIGSPHTPHGYVWPLALVMQALTSTDPSETERVMGYIAASELGDHRLHESFDPDAPQTFTRADFAWPNALYAELVAQGDTSP